MLCFLRRIPLDISPQGISYLGVNVGHNSPTYGAMGKVDAQRAIFLRILPTYALRILNKCRLGYVGVKISAMFEPF